MSTVVDELIAVLGLDVDKASFKKGESAISNVAATWTKFAGIAGAVGGLLTGAINQGTARVENMADSIGVSGDFLDAMGNSVKGLGFDFENAADLVEEMNNKLGESKGLEEITPVTEALDLLNIKFSDLEKLSPEEQFKKIGNAALAMQDQQEAVSAVDILMGGEANKIFGYLRKSGDSFDEIIAKQQAMNFQTEESRKGAVAMTGAISKVMTLFTSLSKLLAGLAGKYLAPLINKFVDLTTSIVMFTKTNIDKYIEQVSYALRILGITIGIMAGYQLATAVIGIAKAFNMAKLAILATNAAAFIIPILIGAAIAAVVAIAQDIYTYFASGGKADTALGNLISWFMKFEIVQDVVGWVRSAFATISQLVGNLINNFSAISSVSDAILFEFNLIKTIISSAFTFIIRTAQAALFELTSLIFGLDIATALADKISSIKSVISEAVSGLINLITSAFTLFAPVITSVIDNAFAGVYSMFDWVEKKAIALMGLAGKVSRFLGFNDDNNEGAEESKNNDGEDSKNEGAEYSKNEGAEYSKNEGAEYSKNDDGSVAEKVLNFFGFNDDNEQPLAPVLPVSPVQALTASPTSGGIVNNSSSNSSSESITNIQIDATGMDRGELNAAIDDRVEKNNAIAAKNNSTGMLF